MKVIRYSLIGLLMGIAVTCAAQGDTNEDCKPGSRTIFIFYAGLPVKKQCTQLCRQQIDLTCKNHVGYRDVWCEFERLTKVGNPPEDAYESRCEVQFDSQADDNAIQR